jgi:multiple sugar transport system permease protein
VYAILCVAGVLMLLPFYWIMLTAVETNDIIFSLPPVWISTHLTFDNFPAVFTYVPFGRMAFNSLIVCTLVTAGALVTSALAAYAFAKLQFPGRDILFVLFLAALMVPQQVTVIPTFILMRYLGLLNSLQAVILPGLINVLGIFLLRQFFLTVPRDLEEAARIDGAGYLRTLVAIVLPLSGPSLSALGIYIFQYHWNDFFWPNVFLSSPELMTLPVGLVALQGLYTNTPVGVVAAAITMIVVPILIIFLFAQRALIESVAMTGLRG